MSCDYMLQLLQVPLEVHFLKHCFSFISKGRKCLFSLFQVNIRLPCLKELDGIGRNMSSQNTGQRLFDAYQPPISTAFTVEFSCVLILSLAW
jgi:hypothetical protein